MQYRNLGTIYKFRNGVAAFWNRPMKWLDGIDLADSFALNSKRPDEAGAFNVAMETTDLCTKMIPNFLNKSK